jgi:hypothetical protein
MSCFVYCACARIAGSFECSPFRSWSPASWPNSFATSPIVESGCFIISTSCDIASSGFARASLIPCATAPIARIARACEARTHALPWLFIWSARVSPMLAAAPATFGVPAVMPAAIPSVAAVPTAANESRASRAPAVAIWLILSSSAWIAASCCRSWST